MANEQTQETWGWTWLERLLQDLRFATRQIRHAPGFALIAILTLALGIGANSAVFTLTYSLLLSSLPVPDPDGLVRLSLDLRRANHRGLRGFRGGWSVDKLQVLRCAQDDNGEEKD